MGHDIDIINVKSNDKIGSTYITGNFSKYKEQYPGIHAIHGHNNSTVIKIIRRTLNLLLDNCIVPRVHNAANRALTFGDEDSQNDLECYAACLQEFLYAAYKIKREYDNDDNDNNYNDIYWYSDQVFEITEFIEEKREE